MRPVCVVFAVCSSTAVPSDSCCVNGKRACMVGRERHRAISTSEAIPAHTHKRKRRVDSLSVVLALTSSLIGHQIPQTDHFCRGVAATD